MADRSNASVARGISAGVLAPLAIGTCAYAFLRPNEAWFVTRLVNVPFVANVIRCLRQVMVPLGGRLPPIVLGVLPDFAWAVAVGSLLAIVWRGRPGHAPLVWGLLGAAFTIGYELAQYGHLVPGTFDGWDLAMQACGYALGWMTHRRASSERHATGVAPAL